MLQTNIEELIRDRTIECSRIEYRDDWNPTDVAHTICAFANDIENIGGGYIILGIAEKNGMPELPIKGLTRESIDRIGKELMGISDLMEPRYVPNTYQEVVDGRDLLVIEVIAGPERPYRCPDSIKSKRTGKSYYIRRLSSTMKADSDDERTLFDVSSDVPFDCRINMTAGFTDLRPSLAYEYLSKVNPKKAEYALAFPPVLLFNDLKILGPPPNNRPINAGILFFNERPERFIEGARIELVMMPDPTGSGMQEIVFNGPLDLQLEGVMNYLSEQVVRVLTVKKGDTPVADRICNYPPAALEEMISNAVYHKDYSSGIPVTVTVRPDRITVTSVPGPDHNITDEQIGNFELHTPIYRNARIGDLLKHRGLAEKRGTGIPTILESLRRNGSRDPVIETDRERRFFRMTVWIHDSFLDAGPDADSTHPSRKGRRDLEQDIVEVLRDRGAVSMRELAEILGYSRNASNLYGCVRGLVEKGRVEYTVPDRMSSRNQRIRLRLRGGR